MVKAVDEGTTTSLELTSSAILPGNSGSIYVKLNNASDLSGLSFEIYYDSSFFSFYYYNVYSALSEANISVNLEEEGIAKVSFTNLNGIYYTGSIMRFDFSSITATSLDNYTLDLAVGEAYDSLLNPININGVDGNILVEEREEIINYINFYNQVDINNLNIGDTFNYSYFSYSLYNLAAGNFQIYYDDSILKINSVNLSSQLSSADVISSINQDISGYVDITFASLDALYDSALFTLEFEVIANTNSISNITVKALDLYDNNLNPINSNIATLQVVTLKVEDPIDFPNIYLTDYEGDISSNFTIEVKVEANSQLAAGDFQVFYDVNKLEVIDITVGEMVSINGGYLLFNPEFSNGVISFSYINSEGLTNEESLLKITLKPKNVTVGTVINMSINGSGVVNDNFDDLFIEYVSNDIAFKDYLAYQEFLTQANLITVDINARQDIINLIETKASLSSIDQQSAEIVINNLISAYNLLINNINSEYQVAVDIATRFSPGFGYIPLDFNSEILLERKVQL
ncbi:MAG: cohesin domain-containing protein [Candidatus Izemoplasmatales bacterium]|nr:cohesin domain-containing protein [Candidatus Izemoplasmatales bacterium]